MFNMIDCPTDFVETMYRVQPEMLDGIFKQNIEVATAMYNNWVAEASEEAQAIPNEDAYAYLFKMRRDELLEIACGIGIYSWRKRDIAAYILYIMGYDVIHHEGEHPKHWMIKEGENV